jgi:acyl carrier protein
MKKNILINKKIDKIFKKLLKKNIKKNIFFEKEEHWDSMAHINLIIAIEKEFKIRISYLESPTLTNKNKIVSFVKNKVNS